MYSVLYYIFGLFVLSSAAINSDFVPIHGRRHDFETGGGEGGGAELEVGRKMCARAQIVDHTHQYVTTSTYSA